MRFRTGLVIGFMILSRASSAEDASAVQTGYAVVKSTPGRAAPSGTLIFSLAQDSNIISEAAVTASAPQVSTLVFVDIHNPGIDTGIAVANPSDTPATLKVQLNDLQRKYIGTAQIGPIPPGGQIAKLVTELLPEALPASGGVLRGVLRIQSDVPVSTIALRLTINEAGETIMTAFPVAGETLSNGNLSLPQIANGGGFKTQIILMNPGSTPITGTAELIGSSGLPLPVGSGGSSLSALNYSIASGGAFFAETDGTGPTSSGWARVVPSPGTPAPVPMAVFGFRPDGVLTSEAAVPPANSTLSARTYVEYCAVRNTGIAVSNPKLAPLELTLNLINAEQPGSVYASTKLTLPPNGQTARYVSELFPSLPTSFRGMLDITSVSEFNVIALRQTFSQNNRSIFTTFPVTDRQATPPVGDLIFPHLAIGGGYQSELILLDNPGTSAAKTAEDAVRALVPDVLVLFRRSAGTDLAVFMDGTYCTNCLAALPVAGVSQIFPTLGPTNLRVLTSKLPAIQTCNIGPYNACLVATGGTPPYTATLLPPSSLPPGLALTPAGCLVGTPDLLLSSGTTERIDVFRVRVTDTRLLFGESGDLSILTKNCVLAYDLPAVLPDAVVGAYYFFPTAGFAAGGIPPYHFLKETASQFPPFGITIEPYSGAIAGTPTTPEQRTFTVCAVDTIGNNQCTPTTLRVRPSYHLTISLVGGGQGRVESAPTGIICGNQCSSTFPDDSTVTLFGFPAVGSFFSGWGGACAGTGTCVVTMNAARAVTATFTSVASENLTLTVLKAGSGSGSVVSAPFGISCGLSCSAGYQAGSQVILAATADAGSNFAGWSGACTGTGNCTLVMDADKSVTANFTSSHSSSGLTGNWQGTWNTEGLSYCAAQSGTWCAALSVSGSTISGTWYDTYNQEELQLSGIFDGTTARWYTGAGDDRIDFTATLSGDNLRGTMAGPVCTPVSGRIQGSFSGTRDRPD